MALVQADLLDLCWAEPCAGSGNILRQMPADRRIGFDINPQDNGEFGIIQADYRQQVLDPLRKWVVLSNPAFSRQPGDKEGGPQTLFAWAAGQVCVVAQGIITPHWFQSPRIENKLNPFFHRTHLEVLPPESFTHNGQVKWSPAIFTFWVRRDYMRDQIVIRDTHPDWEWLPGRRNVEADAWMQTWGVGVGDIKPPDNLGKTNDWSSHMYIKEIRPGTIERLKRINWREVTYLTLSSPRLHKDEIVGAYISAYGDPEAPDYDPKCARGGQDVAPPEASPLILPAAPPEAPAAAEADNHPDLEWIPLRRGIHEASLWIGRRGPHVGKIVDGTKQVPTVPGDHHALRCTAPAVVILRSIPWRSLAIGGTLSKQTITSEYARVKVRGLPK